MRFRFKDRLSLLPLRLHLLFHCVLDLGRRNDVLQLNTGDLDSPGIRCDIQDLLHLRVDDITACQCLVKLHTADDITKGGRVQILKRADRAVDAVRIEPRVKDLEINDRVDLHRNIVLGDNIRRSEVTDLLLQRDLSRDPLDERDLKMKAVLPGRLIASQELNDVGIGLRHNLDARQKQNKYEQNNRQ